MSLMKSLGIDRLSAEVRLQLLQEILASLEGDDEIESGPFTSSQIEEIDCRLRALDLKPESARPWEEVKAECRQRLRCAKSWIAESPLPTQIPLRGSRSKK